MLKIGDSEAEQKISYFIIFFLGGKISKIVARLIFKKIFNATLTSPPRPRQKSPFALCECDDFFLQKAKKCCRFRYFQKEHAIITRFCRCPKSPIRVPFLAGIF